MLRSPRQILIRCLSLALLIGSAGRAQQPVEPLSGPLVVAPVACLDADIPPTWLQLEQSRVLNIRDTGQDARSPHQGWCGETCIQQALAYYGCYAPQPVIHQAGSPRHPDLYASELPVALKAMGAQFEACSQEAYEVNAFIGWCRTHVQKGHPVIAGVKLNPTRHRDWSLDHFVLLKGTGPTSLTYNTTWKYDESGTHEELGSTRSAIAFKNPFDDYDGIAVTGLESRQPGDAVVRVFLRIPWKGQVDLKVKCEGLTPGSRYRLLLASAPGGTEFQTVASFTAHRDAVAFKLVLDASRVVLFRCIPEP